MMKDTINQFIDNLSEFLAHRKGLLPILGICFILLNWILQLLPLTGWLVETNTFFHLGVILALTGFMVAWAL